MMHWLLYLGMLVEVVMTLGYGAESIRTEDRME